jgi:hypothetical protein
MIMENSTGKDKFVETQRQYIYLLLHHEDLVERWLESNIDIDYFDEEFRLILAQIEAAHNNGFSLTFGTFMEHVKSIPVPKDRIEQEFVYSSCGSAFTNKGDYPVLEEKLRQKGQFKVLGDGMAQIDQTLRKTQDCGKVSDILQKMADDLSVKSDDIRHELHQNLQPYLNFPMDSMPEVLRGVITEGSKCCPVHPTMSG